MVVFSRATTRTQNRPFTLNALSAAFPQLAEGRSRMDNLSRTRNLPEPSQDPLGAFVSSQRVLSTTLWAFAALVLAALVARGLSTFDVSWDALAYHLPFSGRLAGLCSKDCYVMMDGLEERFRAFPKSIHYLQAALWRLTGTPYSLGIVNLAAAVGLCVFLRALFRVTLPLAVLAVLAIPLVLIHATSYYVDLATNVAATVALLLFYTLLAEPERFTPTRLIAFFLACAVFANAKPQMIIPGGLMAGAMVATLLVLAWRRAAPFVTATLKPALAASVAVVGLFLVAVTPLSNLVTFGNPVYPIGVTIGPLSLPGPERADQSISIPHPLASIPAAGRWAMSVLEVNAYNFRETPWVIDQGGVAQDKPSFRMGGYNVAFILFNLLVLMFQARSAAVPPRAAKSATALFLATTVVTSLLPLAHELRYYMFWPLTLVSLNLILLHAGAQDPEQRNGMIRLYAVGVLVAFLSAALVTGGRYLLAPHDQNVALLLRGTGIADQVAATVKDGDVACLRETAPLSYLYAPIFHGNRPYTAAEGTAGPCAVTLKRP